MRPIEVYSAQDQSSPQVESLQETLKLHEQQLKTWEHIKRMCDKLDFHPNIFASDDDFFKNLLNVDQYLGSFDLTDRDKFQRLENLLVLFQKFHKELYIHPPKDPSKPQEDRIGMRVLIVLQKMQLRWAQLHGWHNYREDLSSSEPLRGL